MSPEVVDRIVLVVALALCGVVGILAAWVGRLEEQLKDLRRSVGTPAGQIVPSGSLETTQAAPRATFPLPGEKKLHRRPVSLASQAGVRARAESILRERHKAARLENGGVA